MKPSSILWRDYDWDGDPYTPGQLATPGRLLFCVPDPWELGNGNIIDYGPDGERFALAGDALLDVYAAALLNPAHTFILWTANPARAERCIKDDLFAPHVQRRAVQVMETLSGVADREFQVRPINPDTGRQYTAAECAAWAARYGPGCLCAGFGIPQGAPLLSNVWIGARLSGRDFRTHAAHITALGGVPAAVRFLYLPGGCECEFERFVWGMRYEPIPLDTTLLTDGGGELIDTQAVPIHRIDWVICGSINTAAVEYHAAQAIETGTPYWVEAAAHLPLEYSVQMWPMLAGREPRLLPEQAAEERRRRS